MELWIDVSQLSSGGASAFTLHYANLPGGKEIKSPQGKEAAAFAKLPSYVDLKDKIDASVPQAQQSVHEHGAQNSDLDESQQIRRLGEARRQACKVRHKRKQERQDCLSVTGQRMSNRSEHCKRTASSVSSTHQPDQRRRESRKERYVLNRIDIMRVP